MMHIGNYDSEPKSFKKMEEFIQKNYKKRATKVHREIYLSDTPKVVPGKLKILN